MRAVLLAASAAACANALQVAFYTSADCSGAPVVSAYTGNKKCTSVMSTFGMMPYQCGGGSAQLAVYGDPSCGGSPAPGTLISASTTCSALPPSIANAGIWGGDAPASVQLLDTDCAPETFTFTTCGLADCTISPGYGCSPITMPTNAACFDASFYRFSVAKGNAGGVWTETVTMYDSGDVGCNGTVYASVADLPVDGTTCRSFIGGGAFASAPGPDIQPQRPATIPSPATPPGTLRCWAGSVQGNVSNVAKEPGVSAADTAYCITMDNGLGADMFTYYVSGSAANVTMYMVLGGNPTYTSMGYYQNVRVCNTPYCNVPPGETNGAATAAAGWLPLLAAVLVAAISAAV